MRRPALLLLRPVLRRIDQVNELAEEVHNHLPIVESVIESQNAELRTRARAEAAVRAELERLKSDISQLQRQLEELRSASRGPVAGPGADPATELIVARRFGSNGADLRLEFASGRQGTSDRVGVDLGRWRGADAAAHLRELPLAERSAVELRADRVLECFSTAELRSVVIPLWLSLLRAGGQLVVVAVDADANLADYHAGRLTMEQLASASLGAAGAGPPRRAMLGEDFLTRLLADAGFESVETVSRWREDDGTNLIEVRARRGERPTRPMDVASETSVRT